MAVHDLTDQIRQEKVAERYPPLFKRLPDRLFAPLASANRFQYWSLLCVLHAKRFGPEAPLPPSTGFLMREITADIAEELQYQDWTPEGDDVTPATPLAIRAIMVFNRLRDAGWIRVDRVGVREMVTMAPAVAHFMNRLVEFAHTGPEFVSGKIRSIEANLKLLLDESTDGASLQEAARQSRALLEHVRIAGTNVRDLMLEIGRVDATGEFVRRFFDDYVERMADGEMVRKKPANPALFKIGPTSTATRTSIAEQARQLQEKIDEFKERYAKLKELLNNLGPFVGGEQDKVHEVLEIFDRITKEAADEEDLTRRLQALNTEEYRQLVQVKPMDSMITEGLDLGPTGFLALFLDSWGDPIVDQPLGG